MAAELLVAGPVARGIRMPDNLFRPGNEEIEEMKTARMTAFPRIAGDLRHRRRNGKGMTGNG